MVDSPPSPTGYLESVPLDGVSPFPPVERYDFKYLSQSSPLHEKLRQSQEEREETNSEASLTTTAYEAELEAQWRETQATFATLVNLLLIPWSSRELGKKFSHWCSSPFFPTTALSAR